MIYGAFVYNLSKIVLSLITIYLCAHDDLDGECEIQIFNLLSWYKVADMIGHIICFLSTLLMSIFLLYIARKYSRFEYNNHKVYTTLMSIGLLMCYPLQMIGIYYWIVNFDGYIFVPAYING